MTVDELMEALGFCGCGSPDNCLEFMELFLAQMESNEAPRNYSQAMAHPGAIVFVQYCLDEMGFTDHGSSVSYPWLSSEGEMLLEEIRKCEEP